MKSDLGVILGWIVLVFLGTARAMPPVWNAKIHKAAILLNASPAVEPFLGYAGRHALKDFFSYSIAYADGTVESGDHFDRVHKFPGLHQLRIPLLNEAREAPAHANPPTGRMIDFYCRPREPLKIPRSFRVFGQTLNCAAEARGRK